MEKFWNDKIKEIEPYTPKDNEHKVLLNYCKEIKKIINDKIISKYNNEGKKIIMEKSKKLYNEYLNDLIDNIVKDVPKNQQQVLKEFLRKLSDILAQNGFNEINKMEIFVKRISFFTFSFSTFLEGNNEAKVNILVRYKDLDDIDVYEILDETFKESGITSKEAEHFEKINKVKIDKFYNYFENKIKEEIKNSDYNEDTIEMEIEKVNGKWQLFDFDYDYFINEITKSLENNFKNAENDFDD